MSSAGAVSRLRSSLVYRPTLIFPASKPRFTSHFLKLSYQVLKVRPPLISTELRLLWRLACMTPVAAPSFSEPCQNPFPGSVFVQTSNHDLFLCWRSRCRRCFHLCFRTRLGTRRRLLLRQSLDPLFPLSVFLNPCSTLSLLLHERIACMDTLARHLQLSSKIREWRMKVI